MQPHPVQEKIQSFFGTLQSRYGLNRHFILLSLFLLAVIIISYIIPFVDYGHFFGTDDYTHIFHTLKMRSSTGIPNFYENMGNFVSDPSSDTNMYNYPFGVWLFGGTTAKITGLAVVNGTFVLVILFLLVILGSFYHYSGMFLESKEQKILAVLFLLSMPNAVFSLLAFRPSVFTLPFLFIMMYITLKEPFQWKLLPMIWLCIFIIVISHTGTFIFLLSFSVVFYLMYCLIWGRVSLPMYLTLLSTLVIYIFSLAWFPQISNQYEVKSILFLSPGNFLATKFDFTLPLELSNLLYQNVMVNHELAYTVVFGAFIFVLGKLFRFIHRKVMGMFSPNRQVFPAAISLPISNISHSVAAAPLWIGPLHIILSLFGFFRLDSKGKCMLFSLLLVTVMPDMLFEGESATGALREISFLALIIPIVAALGFCQVISYLNTKHPQNKIFSSLVWIVLLLAVIMTPTLITTYYLPKISGENYIIEGMQWLGNNGEISEKVIGYGYRTVPVFTNMTDASYGVQTGYETRTLKRLLSGILFSSQEQYVNDLRRSYGVKYIMTSEKIAENFGSSATEFTIDRNTALNKIYSSKDYGIYDVQSSTISDTRKSFADNITIERTGYSIQVETDVYNVVLNGNYPVIEQFGSPKDNYLGEGFFQDTVQISGLREALYINPFIPIDESAIMNTTFDRFVLNNLSIVPEIQDNQITYRTVLKDQLTGENESSLVVRYTFYPTTIKREFLISNDWVTSPAAPNMRATFSTNMFVPLNNFIIKGNQSTLKRHIFPSQDSVRINEYINDLYLYDGERGIFIKIDPTAPYPTSSTYRGSTIYNMSSISFSQTDSLKPGATLYVTQFLSPGDEVTAEKNILKQEQISILKYPGGIIPIILSGYRTPDSGTGSTEMSERGYLELLNESVPYTEVVVPEQEWEMPIIKNTTTSDETPPLINDTIKVVTTVDLQSINNKNIKILGSSTPSYAKYFKNYSTQSDEISSVIKKADDADISLIGYMPAGLNYNLDTLKIISDNKINLMLSTPISPPYYGIIGLENRNPQMAWYHNERSDVVLLPISYPLSTTLSTHTDTSEVLSAWKAAIDESIISDGMVLFMIRSADIGNPEYTNAIRSLIEYAKTKRLTFITPDVITDYFKKIENIRYTGSIEGDTASINLTNNNNESVQDVTFRVVMPLLKSGGYNVTEGKIVKTKPDDDKIIVYISTDIPAQGSKEITVNPAEPKKKINVTLPHQPIEGSITISVNDMAGNPLTDAEVIIDTKYYFPDKNGDITIDLKRGIHTVLIEVPGYESYTSNLDVKGRIHILVSFFKGDPD